MLAKTKQASLVSKAFHQLSHLHLAFFISFAFCSLFAAFPLSNVSNSELSLKADLLRWCSDSVNLDRVSPEHPVVIVGEPRTVCVADMEAIEFKYFIHITS